MTLEQLGPYYKQLYPKLQEITVKFIQEDDTFTALVTKQNALLFFSSSKNFRIIKDEIDAYLNAYNETY